MHARGVPGSHLIVRVPTGRAATDEDIQFAANLSVHFSKARLSPRWDVTMCQAKHLKKPKGAKPGQVLVTREAVVTGFPDDSAAALSKLEP
jgi:predicted ribosome quality control (RQC) complex YloA/Tae2 family protein